MTDKELMELAKKAGNNSYSPYSHFKVGAALLAKDGRVFCGCNVENVSFGAANCAERTAVFTAVAQGCREFEKIAISGMREGEDYRRTMPCGICRQVLCEFCDASFEVITENGGELCKTTLSELLPFAFELF